MTANQFEPFIAGDVLAARRPPRSPTEYARFFQALADGRAKLAVLLEPVRRTCRRRRAAAPQFAAKLRERFFGFSVVRTPSPILAELRQIKTAYEQDVLRRSVEISSDAHRAGMRAARAGQVRIRSRSRDRRGLSAQRRDELGLSRRSSAADRTRRSFITRNRSRKMEPGDLLLVDAAANYQGLTGDITRTYPVERHVLRREQRDIYDIVFAAQQAGEKAAKIGGRGARHPDRVRRSPARRAAAARPRRPMPAGMQFKIWATHGVTHWIGMDVHDVGVPRARSTPGMAFTIEPGIYIREAALNDLPKTPENAAFIERFGRMVAKYKNIGVRIEDSYLLTTSGLERLSKSRAANRRRNRSVPEGRGNRP